MAETVYVPLSHADAVALRHGGAATTRRGCRPTPELIASLGAGTAVDEAAYAALHYAGVLALLIAGGPRLVAVADVEPRQVADRAGPYGETVVSGLRWPQVRALFADEPETSAAVAAARAELVPKLLTLVEALDRPAVAALLENYDLLWFAVDELERLG